MNRVDGKVALVTGGGSGLGRATSELLSQAGAKVVVSDINLSAAEETVSHIQEQGGEAIAITLDVASETSWGEAMEKALSAFQKLNILVNNAGVIKEVECKDMSLADWRFIHSVNLDGVFLGVRSAINTMLAHQEGGSIINVSSINGLTSGGAATASAYCASKAGVRLLTKSVALECARARNNIRVNAVCPGGMETPMLAQNVVTEEDREARRNAIPMGRDSNPLEVARGILFLASDDSSYMTGSDLVIDGGGTAGF